MNDDYTVTRHKGILYKLYLGFVVFYILAAIVLWTYIIIGA